MEDEAPIRDGLEGILKKLNPVYQVVGKADNGREGLELIRRLRPDVIIVDIRMPDMDGLAMLKTLRKERLETKALIISAYSDFDYAREAMELGVLTYLLKPVRIGELKKALAGAEEELRQEERKNMFLSLENIVSSAMAGLMVDGEEAAKTLQQEYGIRVSENLSLYVVWLGEYYEHYKDIVYRILTEVSEHSRDFECVITSFRDRFHFSMLIYHKREERDLESYFRDAVTPMLKTNTDNRAVCGWMDCGGLSELREAGKRLHELLDWNLTLDGRIMISENLIARLQVYPARYPPEMNVRLKQAVIKRDAGDFSVCLAEFISIFRGRCHDPKEMKENILVFLWTIIHTAREYMALEETGMRIQVILERVMNAFTWEQVEEILNQLFAFVVKEKGEKRGGFSLLVQKAKRLIEEYYNMQITLEEAARQLGVSPEYLSRQYKKETGLSFTEDLRRLKVEKVKTLLVGTTLNLTRIAALTGFSDPKYMSRVFKEEVGLLPADYRKISG